MRSTAERLGTGPSSPQEGGWAVLSAQRTATRRQAQGPPGARLLAAPGSCEVGSSCLVGGPRVAEALVLTGFLPMGRIHTDR